MHAQRASRICLRKHQLLCALAAMLCGALNVVAATPVTDVEDAVTSTTQAGRWRGQSRDGIQRFLGIYYGDDTRQRRFQAALPEPPWTGTRDALHYAPHCPQAVTAQRAVDTTDMSEDCLSLNVWTPDVADGARRPVLVYFHGGGYANGSVNEPVVDGARLSRRGGVVVVTVNHRLNGFGFLDLSALDAERFADSGVVGMLDLLLALQWVRDNIAAFGGNPGNVTIFGQSGGGAKCATLMAMPAARGLFHRVWTMSGQQITGRRRANAEQTARDVLQRLSATPGKDAASIDTLMTAPMSALMEAMRDGTWTPVVDGRRLPRDPFSPDAPPQSAELPMVLGNTHDETTLLIGKNEPTLFALQWPQVAERLHHHVGQFMQGLDAEDVVARYREWYPAYTPSEVFFAASTAARSWKGMVLASDRRAAQGAPTWVYYLHWKSPQDGGRWGAPHTLDIPLVFDTVAADPLTRDGGPAAQQVSDQMSEALIQFARSGDPHHAGLPDWPRFTLPDRPAMIFQSEPVLMLDPRGAERRLFEPAAYLQPGT